MATRVEQFEPLLPTLPQPALDALAEEVCRRGFELKRLVHPVTEVRIAHLLRSVNSYYSNRIEGQQTHPKDIERALRNSFSKEPRKARLQRLAVAHIETQIEMERRLAENPDLAVFSAQFLASLHRDFYGRLPKEERLMQEGDEVAPGYFRRRHVTVGAHAAPDWHFDRGQTRHTRGPANWRVSEYEEQPCHELTSSCANRCAPPSAPTLAR